MTKPDTSGLYTVEPHDTTFGAFIVEECAKEQGINDECHVSGDWQQNELDMAKAISRLNFLLKIESQAKRLLEMYDHKNLTPVEAYCSAWSELKKLLDGDA